MEELHLEHHFRHKQVLKEEGCRVKGKRYKKQVYRSKNVKRHLVKSETKKREASLKKSLGMRHFTAPESW